MDSRHMILVDGEPKPVSLLEWGRWFNEIDNRRIAETFVGEVRISTVFLGIDHNFGAGAPLWFETMIFGGKRDEFCDRYTTLDEARRGHDRAVAMEQEAADAAD